MTETIQTETRKKPGPKPRVRETEVRTEPARAPKQRTRRGAGHDPLNIPDQVLSALWTEGVDLQWNTDTILGQPDVVGITNMTQQGWEPVHAGMFDGRLDYLAPVNHKGVILYQGLRLDWRPRELTEEAKLEDKQAAAMAVRAEEAKLRGGNIDGVAFDTNHPSARAKTYINKERLPSMPIPR